MILDDILKKTASYNNIIIMTHLNPDLDGIASSLLLASFLNAKVLLTNLKIDSSLVKAKEELKKQKLDHYFITLENALKLDKNTLVIVMDTNNEMRVESRELLEKYPNYILIDHHIETNSSLKNPIYKWINQNASSTSEMLILAFKEKNLKINSLFSTLLLAGIDIDTNGYTLKTNENTFLASAYLMKNNADNVLKHELLKENKDIYIKKQFFIRKSYMINKNSAICLLDDVVYENTFLATIAEELLSFDNVDISYVIGKLSTDTVGVSIRSIGKIDAENIARKLGGGGHKTDAACQIKNKTIQEVKEELLKIVEGEA